MYGAPLEWDEEETSPERLVSRYVAEMPEEKARTLKARFEAEIRHLEWPASKWKRPAGSFEAAPVYEGRIAISGELRAPSGPSGRVIVEFQPCDENRCLPATSIALDVESAVERVENSGN